MGSAQHRRRYRPVLQFETIVLAAIGSKAVNVYLIKSSPLTLIDAGAKAKESYEQLDAALRQHGLRIQDLERIVVTHGHFDHFGMARVLADASGAKVYLHPREYAKVVMGWERYGAARAAFAIETGAPKEAVASFEEEFRRNQRFVSDVEDPELIDEGDRLVFDDFSLDVLHVPGHSAGHIALYESDSKVLFSGDLLLRDISSNPTFEPCLNGANGRMRSLPAQLRSLQRLREMDASLVMPGHGEPIHNLRGRIDEVFRQRQKRSEFIYGMLDEEGLSVYALVNKVFRNLAGIHVLLAISETVGHIDVLAEQGRAGFRKSNGVLHCYRIGESTSRTASRATS